MSRFDLATLLHTAVPDLVLGTNGRWRFPLAPGADDWAGLSLVPEWAIFECALPLNETSSPMAAMLRQSEWPGNVKTAGGLVRPTLHAEVPLLVETSADRDWVARQIGEAIQGLRMAAGYRLTESPADDSGDTGPELLVDRCHAAGWNAVVKADGEIHVDIAPRSVRRVVSITRLKTGLRARVSLGNGELAQAGEESLVATARFLHRASSSLRFARAWATGPASAPADAGFECVITPCAGDKPFIAMIDALTTACDLFGSEAEALIENPAVAHRYLQLSQGAPHNAGPAVQQLHGFTSTRVFPRAAAAAASV